MADCAFAAMAVAAADGSKPMGVATPRVGTSVGVLSGLDESGCGVGTSVGAADGSVVDGSAGAVAGSLAGVAGAANAEPEELEAEVWLAALDVELWRGVAVARGAAADGLAAC